MQSHLNATALEGAAERFQTAILALVQPILLKRIEAEERDQTYDADPIEAFIGELFHNWSEIHSSRAGLSLAARMVRTAPSKRLGVSNAEYLRFCIETYFAEIYRIKERLVAYGKTYSRRFAIDKRVAQEFVDLIESSVKDLTDARSEFVHKNRFDDAHIREAEGLELLGQADHERGEAALLSRVGKRRLRSLRKRWAEGLNRQTERVDKLLDGFFKVLYQIVFDETGGLKSPKTLKTQKRT